MTPLTLCFLYEHDVYSGSVILDWLAVRNQPLTKAPAIDPDRKDLDTPFTVRGYWWSDDKPNDYVAGELTFDPSAGVELKLWGSLTGSAIGEESMELVRGTTSENLQVTVISCVRRGLLLQHKTFAVQTYACGYALVGNYFPSPDLAFSSCRFRFSSIDQWIRPDYVEIERPGSDDGLNVQVRKRQHGRINNQGKSYYVELVGNYGYSHESGRKIQVEGFTSAVIVPTANKAAQWYFEEALKFRDLASLCFGLPLPMTSLSLFGAEIELAPKIKSKEYVNVFFAQPLVSTEALISNGYAIVSFSALLKADADVLSHWADQKSLLADAIDLIFISLYNADVHPHIRFLLMMQAFEAFDRAGNKQTLVSARQFEEIYKAMMDAIPDGTSSGMKQKLDSSIKYANEPSLRMRLRNFHRELSTHLGDQPFGFDKRRIGKLVDTRNYYTHYPEELKDKILSLPDTFEEAERFCVLLIVAILGRVGFDIPRLFRGVALHRRFGKFARESRVEAAVPAKAAPNKKRGDKKGGERV